MPKEIRISQLSSLASSLVFSLACIVVSVLFLHLFFVLSESKPASTDVFLFKEVGIQWAKTGQFQVKNLPHQPFDTYSIYSYYPPVYSFVFGLWTKVWGVGLSQSMAFDILLRILRTLFLVILLLPFFKQRHEEKKYGLFLGVWIFVWGLSFFSTEPDRPDELALIFGLAMLWALENQRLVWSGILLGLCGATSPAAGVLFALIVFFIDLKNIKTWAMVGVLSLFTYTLVSLPIFLQKESLEHFSGQLPLSLFPYLNFDNRWLGLVENLIFNFQIGWMYWLTLLGLGLLWAFFFRKASFLLSACLCFIFLVLFVWSLQPQYLWFVIILTSIFILRNTPSLLPLMFMVLVFVPFLFREMKIAAHALQRPFYESRAVVEKIVLSKIEDQSRLAVTEDQFFTFRDKKAIANIAYVCPHLNSYDFVYATPRTRHRARSAQTPIECQGDVSCFKPILELKTNQVFKILNWETSYFVAGNGGTLYKNECLGNN